MTCLVYFALSDELGIVKIGASTGVSKRISTLSQVSGIRLRCIRRLKGGFFAEAMVHAKFRSDRLVGEWFLFSSAIESFVASTRNDRQMSKTHRDDCWQAFKATRNKVLAAMKVSA